MWFLHAGWDISANVLAASQHVECGMGGNMQSTTQGSGGLQWSSESVTG